ncbi:MAG: MerR family transcriptional regulator [Pseudoclavibacter sp.]|nr:MerR family transcriptional regulator [Pseudoclavibacter sp.]
MAEKRLLRIGEFSTLTRLSVRMLRYYDAQGLLRPAATDQASRYRLYEAGQVEEATLIRRLRDVGCTLSAIAALLPLRDDPESLARALKVHRDQLLADAEAARLRIAELDRLIASTRRNLMTDITLTTHPAQRIVSLRRTIDGYAEEGAAWRQFAAELERQGITPSDGPCGTLYHDQEFRESDIDVELWEPAPADAAVQAPLVVHELPARHVAVLVHRGDYARLGEPFGALAQYLSEEGLELAGPMYNRYLRGPMQTQNPEEYLTEVCLPVAPPDRSRT